MFIIKKNDVYEVELINKGKIKSIVRFKGEDILIDNGNIYYSKQEANFAKSEKRIIREFKNKNTNKSGYGTCHYCGKKIHKDSCTVDHIQPLSSFGGRRKIREDKDLWKLAWDKDYNLVLACEECNSEKDNLNANVFEHKLSILDRKAKLLNMRKTKKSAAECYGRENNRKVGFGISTSGSKHNYFSALYMARTDSNILDKNLILNGNY